MVPRLKTRYDEKIVPQLTEKFSYKNRMRVPRLQRIVVNVGMGRAIAEPKLMDSAVEELTKITGQKPVITKAKKAISNFKLRRGLPIGCTVTLRRSHMYEFMDRLCNVALPRVRDFKGVSTKAFDGGGNYTLGVKEHVIFPEVDFDKAEKNMGMNITFVTTARSSEESQALLGALGMPFRKN